ncbi:hypothetical protein WR25_15744 isoform A [Diploscapter pachys]|uniref:THUMP domain-containing protein n=1 Tax=Diploscapter pachys TaxID=2018661 RepID=A0A2A2KYH9_9BILA|nr:hypothetical protein WR25_15744 isoform A [Diploscapter pachys]
MSDNKGKNDKNRKRKFGNWNKHVKQKSVEPGISGLMFTCDGKEREALSEAYNIIDEMLELHPEFRLTDETKDKDKEDKTDESTVNSDKPEGAERGNEKASEDFDEEEEEEDVADKLMKICEGDKTNGSKKKNALKRPFRQRPTGSKNIIFIHVPKVNIPELSDALIETVQKVSKCRHLQRLYPVEKTTSLNLKAISDLIAKMISLHLKSREDGSCPTYAVEFKARNCNSLNRQTVLQMVDDVTRIIAPECRVNLTSPDVTLIVQAVCSTVLVGTARNYNGKAKYSTIVQNKDKTDRL